MAEELGAAVLRVTVDTRLATQALEAFRTQVSQQLGGIGKLDLGKADFSGFIQQAAQAGQQAGKAITAGIEAASKKTKELKFLSFQQALDFSPKNTIKGLQEYATALQKLRDQTSLSAAGTQQLTDRLGAIQAALDRARSTTAQATATQRDFNASLEKTRLKRIAEETKQQEAALKGFAASQREAAAANASAAASSRAAAKAAEEQRKAYLDLARASIGAVGGVASGAVGAASALGKGAVGAIRTGAKVGRAAYGIGAELGIFEDPKPGVINAAIQSVTDKFAFLGKQAQTTRGLILRTLEGVGTGAGLIELARNADLLRESLRAVSVTAKATDASVSAFAKFGNYFANSGLGSIGPLKNLFKGFADLETGTAAITSFTDQLIQIGTKGLSGSVDAIDALVTGFSQLPPAAQAAALAAPAVFAVISGPVGKQAEAQLNKLRSLLEGVGTTSLKVEGQLRDALNAIAREEGILKRAPLALPSSEILQQRLRDSGSRQPQRLEPGVLNAVNNAGLGIAEQYTRQLEAGARAVKSQRDQYIAVQAEASKLLETDLRRQQILNSIARQRASGSGFGAASADNFGVVDPVQKAIRRNQEKTAASEERAQRQRDLFNQDLADVQQRRLAAQKALLQLEEAEKAAAAKRAQAALKQLQDTAATIQRRQQAGADRQAELRAQDFERRLAAVQERNRAQADRRRRLGEAGSNALIGGAFPLLFGQGIGASIGGAAGGGLGGFAGGQLGFGLSLLGTAVGAQFDLASQKAGTLAAALTDPIGKFSELQQAALLSSKNLENQVAALIATGRQAEAAAIIQRDLADSYGSLNNAKELANQTDTLQRSFGQLGVRLAELGAGPLAKVVEIINRALGGAPGDSGVVGDRAFRNQVDAIAGQYGRDAGRRIIFRRNAAEANQVRQDPLGSALGTFSLGLFGRSRGARTELANKEALDYAKSQGLITAEQRATNSLLVQAAALRKQIYELSLKQIDADAGANNALQNGLKFDRIQLETRQKLLDLLSSGKLFDKSNPQQFGPALPFSPEASKALEDQVTQRRQLLALQAQAAKVSSQELEIAKATTGLGREASAIVRQRLEFQQRFKDLQAERQTASDRFATVMANPRATNDERVFAANAFIEAANKVKVAGIDFYNQITAAAKQAREQFLAASLERARQLTTRDQGLNKFLRPDVVTQRQGQGAELLKPQLAAAVKAAGGFEKLNQESQRRYVAFMGQVTKATTVITGYINGIPIKETRQPTANDAEWAQEFINAAKSDQDSKQALIDANKAVVASNEALASGAQKLTEILPNLAKIMDGLVGKDWTVNVNVPGGSASGAVVGAVNGGL